VRILVALSGRVPSGCQDGRGTFIWPDNSRYVGYFVKGKKDGEGADAHPHGPRSCRLPKGPARPRLAWAGTYITKDGRSFTASWQNDRLHTSVMTSGMDAAGAGNGPPRTRSTSPVKQLQNRARSPTPVEGASLPSPASRGIVAK
jgi:hypothetical protein